MTTSTDIKTPIKLPADENPIRFSSNLLKKEGWARGTFLCETVDTGDVAVNKNGSRCAIGAVRAAFGLSEDQRYYLVVGYEQAETERFSVKTQRWVKSNVWRAKVKRAPQNLQKRYRDAVLLLADAVNPNWEKEQWRSFAEHNYVTGVYSDTASEYAQDTYDIKTIKDLRSKIPVSYLEDIVIGFNDDLDATPESRRKVLRRFDKAAKAWDAAHSG